jgi:hypothetical protein
MYIVLSAWLYVTVLMAINETSIIAGILSFLIYGLIPGSLFWWLLGGRRHKQEDAKRTAERDRQTKNSAKSAELLTDPVADQGNRSDTQANQ